MANKLLNPKEVYLSIIEDTIQRTQANNENTVLLDKLKRIWISKLEDRLRTGQVSPELSFVSKASDPIQQAPIGQKSFNGNPVGSTQAFPVTQQSLQASSDKMKKVRKVTSEDTINNSAKKPRTAISFRLRPVASTGLNIARPLPMGSQGSSSSAPIEVGDEPSEPEEEKPSTAPTPTPSSSFFMDDADLGNSLGEIIQEDFPPKQILEEEEEMEESKEDLKEEEDEEDEEWETTEWESALPPSLLKKQESSSGDSATLGDASLDDVSDLDDEEPEATDHLVAQFETIQRPQSKKGTQRGVWRLVLKHGIVHVGPHELFFHSMVGDLR